MSAIVRAVSRRHPLAVAATSLAAFSALHLGLAKLLRPMIPLARPKEREGFNWLLASRLTCVCHALLIMVMGFAIFRETGGSLWRLVWTAKHTASEVSVMAVSAGFFIQDWVYIVKKEWDLPFFCHHTFVLAFLAASGISGRVGRVCVAGLLVGELTNPLQNGFWISRALSLRRLQAVLLPLFSLGYLGVRLLLSPLMSFLIVRECLLSSGTLPRRLLNYLFAVLGVLLNGGSVWWAHGLIRYNLRFYGIIGNMASRRQAEDNPDQPQQPSSASPEPAEPEMASYYKDGDAEGAEPQLSEHYGAKLDLGEDSTDSGSSKDGSESQ